MTSHIEFCLFDTERVVNVAWLWDAGSDGRGRLSNHVNTGRALSTAGEENRDLSASHRRRRGRPAEIGRADLIAFGERRYGAQASPELGCSLDQHCTIGPAQEADD